MSTLILVRSFKWNVQKQQNNDLICIKNIQFTGAMELLIVNPIDQTVTMETRRKTYN